MNSINHSTTRPPRLAATLPMCKILLTCCLALRLLTVSERCLGAEGDEHARITISSDLDSFDQPYGGSLQVLALSKTGQTFFYPQPFFSFPVPIYLGTPDGVRNMIIPRLTQAPDGGTLGGVADCDMNSAGQCAFTAGSDHGTNIYLFTANTIRRIAATDAPAAGDGNFKPSAFTGIPALSETGKVAFHALTTASGQGIFLASPSGASSTIQRIARIGDSSLDGGVFTGFNTDVAVDAPATGLPHVAFTATTSGSTSRGLYLGTATKITLIATGNHSDFKMNDAGQLLFIDRDIILATEAGAQPVISVGSAAPGGAEFTSFQTAVINDHGQIAFSANIHDSNTNTYSSGIFLWTAPSTIKVVALNGQLSGDGGTFTSFGTPQLNNVGLAMFTATVKRGTDSFYGIYFGNGTDLIKIIATGDHLLDSIVAEEGFFSSNGPIPAAGGYLPGHGSFNDQNQVSYRAKLANGNSGIFLSIPSLHWRATGDGSWDTVGNWTLGAIPSAAQNVMIDPLTDLTVTGPGVDSPASVKSVRSLVVGGNSGAAVLKLQPGVALTVKNGVTIAPGGTLTGAGTISGSLTMKPGSSVAVVIGSNNRGNKTGVIKTGTAILDGTLEVGVEPGFVPNLGDTFDLLDLGKTTGSFAAVHLPALTTPGVVWDATASPSVLYKTGKITVVMATELRGGYAGLVRAGSVDSSSSGFFNVSILPTGTFTGKPVFNGASLTLSGKIDSQGNLTLKKDIIDKAGHRLTDLHLDMIQRPGQITGTVVDAQNAFVADVTGDRTPAFAKITPSPYQGSYTVAFPTPFPGDFSRPQGSGYATLKVDATGKATFVGALGDGTTLSLGGMVTEGGELPLYRVLYGKTGLVSGVLILHAPRADALVEGSIDWVKPNTAAAKPYPDAFSAPIVVIGSGYVAPAKGHAPLTFPLTIKVTANGISPVNPVVVSINSSNKIAFDLMTALKAIGFTPTSGLFTGKFQATSTGSLKSQSLSFKGVVLQKQNRAAGFFKVSTGTGSAILE